MKADIILADPAWKFVTWSAKGRGRSPKYRTEAIERICSLPVQDLSAKNCALFIWVTWPMIFDAKDVIDAWGFTYRTLAWEWLKLNKLWYKIALTMLSEKDVPLLYKLFFMGLGYYTRANPEPCLLAVKGRMPVAIKNERNILLAPIGKHSSKPEEQYKKIERLYPASVYPTRIEIYSRAKYPGWLSLGDALDGKDLRESIPDLAKNSNSR